MLGFEKTGATLLWPITKISCWLYSYGCWHGCCFRS